MADKNDKKYDSCTDERLAQIIFVEGCLKSFNEEYWHPELNKYADFRHERVLESLRQGTRHHLEGNFSDMEYSKGDENMYYNSYDCTHHQKSEEMYSMFVEEVNKHVVQNIFPKIKAVTDDNLLNVLASNWGTYKTTIHTFSKLFEHLTLWIEDVPEDETPEDGIEKIGLKVFKKEIVEQNEIKDRLTSVLNQKTDEHREGKNINCEEIKTLCGMLLDMKCYEDVFENNFIQQAKEYYKNIAKHNIDNLSSYQYVLEVETIIANEKTRTDSYGNEKTTDKVRMVLQEVLITDNLKAIALREKCGGIQRMLEENSEDQLKSVYETFKRVKGGFKTLRECLCSYEHAEGKKVLKETADKASAETQVNRLVQLKNTCEKLVSYAFAKNHSFQLEVLETFSQIISNKNVYESLSTFVDMKKMKSITGENEKKEMNEICNKFMSIFMTFAGDKTDFKPAYVKHFNRRLAKVRSPYLAYDKKIVELMKSVTSSVWTKEIEMTIKDFEESKVFNKTFIKEVNAINGVKSSFTVVNSHTWPSHKKLDANLMPSAVSNCFEKFKQFYQKANQSNHATLTVLNKNFVAEVSYNLPTKNYTLQLCSCYQFAVMELFNKKSQFTFEELLNETKLSVKDLTEVLRSLTSNKSNILLKCPSVSTYSSTDKFTVNEGFASQSDKIMVLMPSKSAA